MNLVTLVVIVSGTIALGFVGWCLASSPWQRTFLVGTLSGLSIYSGIGAAYPEIPWVYMVYYFGFLTAVIFGYKFFCVCFQGLSRRVGRLRPILFAKVDTAPLWGGVIWLYLILHLVPLIYPEFRLHLLFSPPSPDLTSVFASRWIGNEAGLVQKLLEYAKLLTAPFFYVALFRYRIRVGRLIFTLAAPLYLEYLSRSYVGRGHVLVVLGLVWLALWTYQPRKRPMFLLIGAASLPAILVASYVYGVVRIGGTVGNVDVWQASVEILESETSFPRKVGMPLIEGGYQVDFENYAKWVLTLPVPKIITGEIEGARVNYEISELVLGVGPGQKGWYVVLPGLVAESIYIYGPYLFWIHGVFVAFWAALLARIVERTPELLFLAAYTALQFTYILNRGGISAVLPVLTNEFILFYCVILMALLRLIPGQLRMSWQPEFQDRIPE